MTTKLTTTGIKLTKTVFQKITRIAFIERKQNTLKHTNLTNRKSQKFQMKEEFIKSKINIFSVQYYIQYARLTGYGKCRAIRRVRLFRLQAKEVARTET